MPFTIDQMQQFVDILDQKYGLQIKRVVVGVIARRRLLQAVPAEIRTCDPATKTHYIGEIPIELDSDHPQSFVVEFHTQGPLSGTFGDGANPFIDPY